MAKITDKITQLRWFYGSSLTTTFSGKSHIPVLKTTIKLKTPLLPFPRSQVVFHRCCRSIMKTNSTSPVKVLETIDPTDKEKQIFDQLRKVLLHFNLQTQLRVAGGWVRDKLLGKECYDIDIAIDNMLGKEFCEKVNEYLVSTGEQTQGIGVIQSNPDQSKHLETARMRLLDVWIDFVNLRSEDYTENSRIPTMQFGTPEQDAYRRDLTINSLFYNINTCSVEDFTKRGLNDLKNGKIVTPLPPKETFLDDPLRVLRAIRFSARFDFEMDEELKIAASDNDVKSAIGGKISRERIGHEIDLMITGNKPEKAVTYISDLGLFWVVFTSPENSNPSISKDHDKTCVEHIKLALTQYHELGSNITFTNEQKRIYLYASLFLPLKKINYIDNKKKSQPVVSYIFKNSLKLKISDLDDVIKVHNGVEKFLSLVPFILSNKDMDKVEWEPDMIEVDVKLKSRILLGLILREMKELWRVALMLTSIVWEEVEKRGEVFLEVEKEIVGLGLERVWEVKPLVNGKEIMKYLGLEKGGPVVSEWQRKIVQWQLAYPNGSVEECVDWMKREMQMKRART